MTLTLTILGCASSGGVPRVGGSSQKDRWGNCDPANPKNRRRRCSVLLERRGPGGSTYCVIDSGPDFREQMLEADVSHIDAVVYTHEHADHLHGIDDLRPYALTQRSRIRVFMDDRTFDRARSAFGYVFETPNGSSYPPILDRQTINHREDVIVDGPGGEIIIKPVPVTHGDITALGFRIGDALYLPDVSNVPQSSLVHFEGLKTLILDALRYRPHGSHFNVEQALAFHESAKPARTVLTNLHIDLDYETLNGETPSQIEPAYDGLSISVG
ncbi:MAG: MBL fold metallo-hydrolase [Cohaesibacteraceae bacterium]